MLNEILKMAQQHLNQENQLADTDEGTRQRIFEVANETLGGQMKNEIANGNIGELMSLFNGENNTTSGNRMVENFAGPLVSNIAEKVGVSPQMAQQVVSQILPVIMSKFSSPETGRADTPSDFVKTVGLDGDQDIQGLISNLTGEKMGGIGSMLGGFLK